MTVQEAIKKGFLQLTEDESTKVLETIFDNDDAEKRLDEGLGLMRTFIPEDKLGYVLDLASVVLDAYDELEYYEEESGSDDVEEEGDESESR